jgi:choline dehydrogenase-like flavoprotein
MHYLSDPRDVEVMVAVARRALDIVGHWPSHRRLGPMMVPPVLARRHDHHEGAIPSDAFLEDYARWFSLTVYHLCRTCRIGSVVDAHLNVFGVEGLRVADASVMPEILSGNTNADSIMIGEKAAEMIAADHDVHLLQFVGEHQAAAS